MSYESNLATERSQLAAEKTAFLERARIKDVPPHVAEFIWEELERVKNKYEFLLDYRMMMGR